jgi:hypothetical protein
MPMGITIDNRTRSHHLGVQYRMLTNQAQEIATVAISPVHHRGNAEFSIDWHSLLRLFLFRWVFYISFGVLVVLIDRCIS